MYDQRGRLAIITGGNRGIGLHVVEKLLACQITVVMGVRNVEVSQKAVFAAIPEEIRRNLLHFETLDTGSLKSVRDFAATIKAKYPKVDLLINNGEVEMIFILSCHWVNFPLFSFSWNHGSSSKDYK